MARKKKKTEESDSEKALRIQQELGVARLGKGITFLRPRGYKEKLERIQKEIEETERLTEESVLREKMRLLKLIDEDLALDREISNMWIKINDEVAKISRNHDMFYVVFERKTVDKQTLQGIDKQTFWVISIGLGFPYKQSSIKPTSQFAVTNLE